MRARNIMAILRNLKARLAGVKSGKQPPSSGGTEPQPPISWLRTIGWTSAVCAGFVGIGLFGAWCLGEFDDTSIVASPAISYIKTDENRTAWVMIPNPQAVGSYTVESYPADPVVRRYTTPDAVSHALLLHADNGTYARKVGDSIQPLTQWDSTHRPAGCESATVDECIKVFAGRQNTQPASASFVAVDAKYEVATVFLSDWRVETFVPEAVDPLYTTPNANSGATLVRVGDYWERHLPDGSFSRLYHQYAGHSFADECTGKDTCQPKWVEECQSQAACQKEWDKAAKAEKIAKRRNCHEEQWVERTEVDEKTGARTTTKTKVPPPAECTADDTNQDVGVDVSWGRWVMGILGATNAFLLQLIVPTVFVTFITWALMNWKRRGSILPSMPFGAGAGEPAKGAGTQGTGDEANIKIVVTKPENNHWRLKDLIVNDDVMQELLPFIEAIKAQRVATDALVAEAAEKYKKETKDKAKWIKDKEQTPAALGVSIPAIPEGRFGYIQNTKYLLAGPPGVGKSLAAMVAAGEAGVTLVSISGSVSNTFIGKDAANVHALVELAKKYAPCIIFMDEADETAKQRGKNVGMGGATGDAGTTALLAEIDGIESKGGGHNGVHWMAATNYIDKIDEAIKRSGRLKVLNFTLPGINALKKLLQLFFGKLTKLPLLPDFRPASDAVASMLVGKTGADIQELANSFAGLAQEVEKSLRKRLDSSGLSAEQIEEKLSALKFGQKHFIESLLRTLMGRKKEVSQETFEETADTAFHEGLHGLSTAACELLELFGKKVRLLTVANRERSLGLMYASFDREVQKMSIQNIIGNAIICYAGAMAQLVAHDDRKRWGKELDLHRDSGQLMDNRQAADLIHQAITTFGGSLEIGPISKGQGGHTWFTEMGPSLVDDIDKQVRVYQKLGQFLAWHIATILMQNDVVWEMFDEVLNSPERIILQDKFYQYWDRIIADRKIRKQLLALPGLYRKMAEQTKPVKVSNPNQSGPATIKAEEPAVLSWMPPRQSWFARRYISQKSIWLRARYEEAQRKLVKAEGESSDMDGLIAAALISAPPAVTAPEAPPVVNPAGTAEFGGQS